MKGRKEGRKEKKNKRESKEGKEKRGERWRIAIGLCTRTTIRIR